jgi:hypothetical protein
MPANVHLQRLVQLPATLAFRPATEPKDTEIPVILDKPQ